MCVCLLSKVSVPQRSLCIPEQERHRVSWALLKRTAGLHASVRERGGTSLLLTKVFFSAVDMSDTSNPCLFVVFISESLASNIATSAVVRWVCSLWPVAAVMRSSTVARPAKRKRGMNATETSVSVCQVGTRSRSICKTPTQTLYLTLPQSCRFCPKTHTFGLFQ